GYAGRSAMALVPRENIVEPFFLEHCNGFLQPEQEIGGRRIRPGADLVDGYDVLPIPIGSHRGVGLRHRERLFRYRVEAKTRRQHQSLLRACDRYVDAPGVVLGFERTE